MPSHAIGSDTIPPQHPPSSSRFLILQLKVLGELLDESTDPEQHRRNMAKVSSVLQSVCRPSRGPLPAHAHIALAFYSCPSIRLAPYSCPSIRLRVLSQESRAAVDLPCSNQ
jgi:hypothetical protein